MCKQLVTQISRDTQTHNPHWAPACTKPTNRKIQCCMTTRDNTCKTCFFVHELMVPYMLAHVCVHWWSGASFVPPSDSVPQCEPCYSTNIIRTDDQKSKEWLIGDPIATPWVDFRLKAQAAMTLTPLLNVFCNIDSYTFCLISRRCKLKPTSPSPLPPNTKMSELPEEKQNRTSWG